MRVRLRAGLALSSPHPVAARHCKTFVQARAHSRHRRSSRRWVEGQSGNESTNIEAIESSTRETHPVEALVASLLEPSDAEQRAQDYDWYIRYPTTDLSTHALGEEKDLKLYVRAARIAEGEGVDNLLATGLGNDTTTVGTVAGVTEDVIKANTQFYESWVKG